MGTLAAIVHSTMLCVRASKRAMALKVLALTAVIARLQNKRSAEEGKMVAFVFVCSVEDKNPKAGWEKTRFKSLSKWIAGTRAAEMPIGSDSRPGLTRFCYKLPDGRRVRCDTMDAETMVVHCEWDRALDSSIGYIAGAKVPARWRAKALGDAIDAESAKRKMS